MTEHSAGPGFAAGACADTDHLPDRRVQSVSTDHQVVAAARAIGEGHLHALVVLRQGGDGGERPGTGTGFPSVSPPRGLRSEHPLRRKDGPVTTSTDDNRSLPITIGTRKAEAPELSGDEPRSRRLRGIA